MARPSKPVVAGVSMGSAWPLAGIGCQYEAPCSGWTTTARPRITSAVLIVGLRAGIPVRAGIIPHTIPAPPRAVPSYSGQCGVTGIQKTLLAGRNSLLNSRYAYGRSRAQPWHPRCRSQRHAWVERLDVPLPALPLLGHRGRRHEPPGPPDA